MNFFNILIIFLLAFSCTQKHESCFDENQFQKIKLDFAKNFEIKKRESEFIVRVGSPDEIQKTYFLFPKETKKPKKCSSNVSYISYPLEKIATLSSTHIPFLKAIKKINSVKAVAEKKMIYAPEIRNSSIQELGAPLVNIEKTKKMELDAIFTFFTKSSSFNQSRELERMNIPILYVQEFKEEHPLGRTEWIKFFSLFFNKFSEGSEIFNEVKKNYLQIKKKAQERNFSKKIIIGYPIQGIWHAPSSKSDLAQLVRDAGFSYIWNKEIGKVRIPLESALLALREADVWLPQNNWKSREEALRTEKRIENFPIFQKNFVYNFNKRIFLGNNYIANDYWEEALFRSDLLLNDLLLIFENKNDTVWFKSLEK